MRCLVLLTLLVGLAGCRGGNAGQGDKPPAKVQVTITPEEKRIVDQYQDLTPENQQEVDQFVDKLTKREAREDSMRRKLWIAGCGLGVLAAAAGLLKLAGVL